MNTFSNIKEIISTLNKEHKLLSEMFSKRKSLSYRYDEALSAVDDDKRRMDFLIERSVIRENGAFLEIDDQYIQFFEQILEELFCNLLFLHLHQNVLFHIVKNLFLLFLILQNRIR